MWVWVNSGNWWWTGRPGVLQFMGSQRVGHEWATELSCGLYIPWNFLGQNREYPLEWVAHSFLQGIFPTQGLHPDLLHCRRILYWLSHKGSPRILEWVGYPFSRGSSWPRNWTRVSCIAGRLLTIWAIREAPSHWTSREYPKIWVLILNLPLAYIWC